MNTKKSCFNCAKCSEHYPSFKDSCDIDNHEIKDAENECCDGFVLCED